MILIRKRLMSCLFNRSWFCLILKYLLLIILVLGAMYLAFLHLWPQAAVVALLLLAGLYLFGLLSRREINVHARLNDTVEAFARNFDVRFINTWVIRSVYECLFDYFKHAVRKNDRFKKNLHITEADLTKLVSEIAMRTNRMLDCEQPFEGKTVGELVIYINHLRKNQF